MMATLATPAQHALGLFSCIAICFVAASVGSAFTLPEINGWYATLAKPTWNPPNWIFGPVWSTLYLLMAISVWLVWRQAGFGGASLALAMFGIQLSLNVLWSILFFGLHRPDLAAIDIVALWVAIAVTIWRFWQHSRTASGLLAPYLAWVSFALILNIEIWRMQL